MKGERVLIIGGTGSLGNKLIERWAPENNVLIYSRDECKQWTMKTEFSYKNYSKNVEFMVGDIRDINKLETTFLRWNPSMIIIAAALKHIDLYEYDVDECLLTNFQGTQNVLNVIDRRISDLGNLKCVCLTSTDKACSPVNVYGMSKALAEKAMIEKSKHIPSIKFVTVRYGNVLNSRGSVIPKLHIIGKDENIKEYCLTSNEMTRFVMTLEQATDLIEYSIFYGTSGDIVIPKLSSMKVPDLIELFAEKYNKKVTTTGIRPGEKILESLINETQSRMTVKKGDHYHIRPIHNPICEGEETIEIIDYNSTINPISKKELKKYLIDLGLY
jgi:UDP-N-acetylglucosamine 4,6-dehydratase